MTAPTWTPDDEAFFAVATAGGGRTWEPLDIVTLGDAPQVPPAIGGLIYPGQRHTFQGESESGKTWCAMALAAGELHAGRGVVWVDLDYMGPRLLLERLRAFGVSDETTRRLFLLFSRTPRSTVRRS